MNKRLYFGNLNYESTEDTIRKACEEFGTVEEVNIFQGKGFGFVTMSSPEEAQATKDGLNGKEIDGRTIRVDEARPREERSPRQGDLGRSFRSHQNNRSGNQGW